MCKHGTVLVCARLMVHTLVMENRALNVQGKERVWSEE